MLVDDRADEDGWLGNADVAVVVVVVVMMPAAALVVALTNADVDEVVEVPMDVFPKKVCLLATTALGTECDICMDGGREEPSPSFERDTADGPGEFKADCD